ncbi:MAG: peptidoglycan DD-metalloendopeptidase family protein [Flavobacteriaceae bacterium]|nr:peptidoglycan DD-metalloendopeptidase family protein [Flavobacteriaceae bacterium]
MITAAFGQSKKQRQLETKRQNILKEITEISSLLSDNKSEATSLLTKIEDVNLKISVRKKLVQITNQQANLLTREIKDNSGKIETLETDLALRKKDYAAMVVKSYKNKATQSKLMFLLSSDNFQQAYKRYNYMKQYKRYQKNQADSIVSKTEKLVFLNESLLLKKEDKVRLINENKKVQQTLQKEKNSQRKLIAELKKDESKYKKEIVAKQKENNKIDRQIEKLIRDAIARSNKKAGKKKTSKSFALTPEAKALANSFTANKGKLGWPVKTGRVIQKFGTTKHPTLPGINRQCSGVRIITSKNSIVRSVFNGTVSQIQVIKGGNKAVIIRHGNYLTIYLNLINVTIKKGDKVSTNMPIGKVATNSEGKTIIKFLLYKNSTKLNPAHWIYKM